MKLIVNKLIIVIAFLVGCDVVVAQTVKPLNVGDKVTDMIFTDVMNYRSSKLRLSDFKNKAIILDFWATWCGPCVEGIGKLESFEKQFKDKLQVLLVNSKTTSDDEKKISSFFEKRKARTNLNFPISPMIIKDTLLAQVFPHTAIPHYVWINNNGIVVAITSHREITAENIKSFIEGKILSLKTVKVAKALWFKGKELEDFFYPNKDSKVVDYEPANDIYRAQDSICKFMTGFQEGQNGDAAVTSEGKVGMVLFNVTKWDLVNRAYGDKLRPFSGSRLILDVTDPLAFKYPFDDELSLKYKYCYGIILPKNILIEEVDNMIFSNLRGDLKKVFNISVRTEKRKMNCWILSSLSKQKPKTVNDSKPDISLETENLKKYIHNMPLGEVIAIFNSMLDMPLLNELRLDMVIDVDLPFDLTNQVGLIESLKKCGFELKQEERELEVAIVTDK